MWSGRSIVAAGALLLAACGGDRGGAVPPAARDSAPAPAADAAPAAEPAIVFLGTSLTAGYGLDPDSAYPSHIQRMLDSAGLRYRVVNAGQSGESSAGALTRIDWLLRQRPAVLIIETGANDGLRGQDPDSTRANIQAIIDRTRAASPGTAILLSPMEALPNLGERYVRKFRGIFPALAEANHVTLLPFILDGVAGVDSLNQGDGIHPNDRGSHIVAANVWRGLLPVLRAIGGHS